MAENRGQAIREHRRYQGKIQIAPKCRVERLADFATWYTPGVAEPCLAINKTPGLSYELTNRANTVAVVSDGTRVLGLGNIGPLAAMPVMEGKALIFKYFGGVDAVPLCLDTASPDDFIETVKRLEPSFGGINLEDIAQPKCFYILRRLKEEMDIPVWHDDQQGTAAVTLAALLNALAVRGSKLGTARITLVGAGAANIRTARLLIAAGADPEKMIICDSKGTLHAGRDDLTETHREKWALCLETNREQRRGGIREALNGQDVLIALSRPGPGIIKPEWIKDMADQPVVFACANPVPEIWPEEAKEAGAEIVATGRSDFPNQVNNSLGFPAIFRGALDVRARAITDEMCIAAAETLAEYARKQGISREYIIPRMDEWEVYPRVAAAVGLRAVEQGVAGVEVAYEQLYQRSYEIISRARAMNDLLLNEGIIEK